MRLPFRLPDVVRNPISLLGGAMSTAMAILFAALVVLESLGFLNNPYVGLVIFIAVPAVFLIGLALIPAGGWWAARRRRRSPGAREWPLIDLAQSRHRRLFAAVLVLTLVNLTIVSLAAYGGVHYMEQREFCGQVCHTTMEPEFVAQEGWPHATLACVSCHVGPGVGPLIESKLAGTRQLYHLIAGQIPKPIPAPVRSLGDTRNTCERCHWRDRPVTDVVRQLREYASDEQNTETTTTLRMHVGGPGGPGIHRHMGLDIEYVATDERRGTIPFVRIRDESGAVREFVAEGVSQSEIAQGSRRRMDCTDCHNRPAHTFSWTPERAVDASLANGRLPRNLAFVRREAVAAAAGDYSDRDAANAGIARRLNEFYAGGAHDTRLVTQAIDATRDIWNRNVFPAMKVKWGTYPNHLGHVDSPGCFRCHDDSHKSSDGKAISGDCELCHTIE